MFSIISYRIALLSSIEGYCIPVPPYLTQTRIEIGHEMYMIIVNCFAKASSCARAAKPNLARRHAKAVAIQIARFIQLRGEECWPRKERKGHHKEGCDAFELVRVRVRVVLAVMIRVVLSGAPLVVLWGPGEGDCGSTQSWGLVVSVKPPFQSGPRYEQLLARLSDTSQTGIPQLYDCSMLFLKLPWVVSPFFPFDLALDRVGESGERRWTLTFQ